MTATVAPDLAVDLAREGYTHAEPVAHGGSSVVFRAWEAALERWVALKVVLVADPDGRVLRRFERERRALGPLSGHPGIVTVHRANHTGGGLPYLAMEYVAGGSLADRIRRCGTLGVVEAVAIVLGVADALVAAHEAGRLHRDVKPDNVLLAADGMPRLADFGVASVRGEPGTTTVMATVAYAPPEVFNGAAVDARADVYSLGATLFAALAGHPPFGSADDEAGAVVVARVLVEPAPDLCTAGVPAPVADVVAAALAKCPDDRPASVAAFAAALRAAVGPLPPVPVPPPALPGRPETLPLRPQALPVPPPVASTEAMPDRPVLPGHPGRRRGGRVARGMAVLLAAGLAASGGYAAVRSFADAPARTTTTTTATTTTTTFPEVDGPVVTVEPAAGLLSGETVAVAGEGLEPSSQVVAVQCVELGDDDALCDLLRLETGVVGDDGTVELDLIVRRGPFGPEELECGDPYPCAVHLEESGGGDVADPVELTFG